MLFNSLRYLIFFPVVAGMVFAVPARYRPAVLALASCYFYMVFRPAYILILFAVIAIDYFSALFIERRTGRLRRLGLVISILSNVGILCLFKYSDFAIDNLAAAVRVLHLEHTVSVPPALNLLLPIGLSFHTFQSLAYTIEVFYGRYAAERNPIRFALYVLFFPQMVAGPIERPQGLLAQLRVDQEFSHASAVAGLRLILIGMWNKVLVADNIASYVDAVYDHAGRASGVAATLGTVGFAIQIYCDFLGYSQIAVGSAKVLGIDLMANFNHPYRAASFADFWHRWHISLSTWFRDYVYIPLGGGRVAGWRADRNILAVFMLSGLWHGANWTYVAWGSLHGLYLLAERHAPRRAGTVNARAAFAYRVLVLVLVCLAWVFFRAHSIPDAFVLMRAIASGWSTAGADVRATGAALLRRGSAVNGLAVGVIFYLALAPLVRLSGDASRRSARSVRWCVYYVMIIAILMFGRFESRTFIYFQF